MISISSQVDFAMPTSSTTQTQFYRYLNETTIKVCSLILVR